MQDILSAFRPDLFAGKTVVVSGGSSGIGFAMAQGFARLGATVIATGATSDALGRGRASAGRSGIRFERLDVRDKKAVDAFFAALPTSMCWSIRQGIARPEAE